MKKTAIFIYSLILSFQVCAATLHSEDSLLVDGERYLVRADPLYRYLSVSCRADRLEAYVNDFCIPYGTDFTRYWEIKNGRLYLVKIKTDTTAEEYPLEFLFSDYDGSPIEAKWFSGILSYRKGDSPVIQLNREYYEEESVVRIVEGKVVERFVTSHKERWISYAERLMDKHYLLAAEAPGSSEDPLFNVPASEGEMVGFLEDLFSPVTHPEDKPPVHYPIVEIKFSANLDDLQLTEVHRGLSGHKLLKTIVEETQTTLNISISNRVVSFEIRDTELAGNEQASASECAGEGISSE